MQTNKKGLYHGVDNFVRDPSFMKLVGLEAGLKGKTYILQVDIVLST